MQEFYHKWHTQYLSRDFEMLVFGNSGYPVVLFPTLKGRYFENKDNGLIDSASGLLNSGKIRIYCPDGIDEQSWCNYSISPADRIKTHLAYERVILNDVIEFAKFESGSKTVAVAGCGFGGYHALNIAFKYPDKIKSLICMSGLYGIKDHIFGYSNDNSYFNSPLDYMPNLTDEWYLDRIKKMRIILGVGENDFAIEENAQMSSILASKNIEHKFDVRIQATHSWNLWKEIFPEYLSLF